MNIGYLIVLHQCLLAASALAAEPQLVGRVAPWTDQMTTIAYSPDGRYLAGGGWEKVVRVWDLQQSGWIRIFEEPTGRTLAVSFSPDGKTLAASSNDARVYLWEMETGKLKRVLKGQEEWIPSVVFAPDGKTLATAHHEYKDDSGQRRFARAVKLWDPATGELRQTLNEEEGMVSGLAFSPDGATLAAALKSGGAEKSFRGVRVWELKTGKVVKQFPVDAEGVPIAVAFSPDGKQLACGGGFCRRADGQGGVITGQTWLWEVSSNRLVRTLGEPGVDYHHTISFAPDGQTLAVQCTALFVTASGWQTLSGYVDLWNIATGKLVWKVQENVDAVAFSPDGTTIATCGRSRLQLLDAKTGTTRQVLWKFTNTSKEIKKQP